MPVVPLLILGVGAVALWVLLARADQAAAYLEDSAVGAALGLDRVDDLGELDAEFRSQIERVYARLRARGYTPLAWETYRTPARQAWLYASGRTREGSVLTNVQAGGAHQDRRAVDTIDGRSHPSRPGYYGWGSWAAEYGDQATDDDHQADAGARDFFAAYGEEIEAEGLEWGGRWTGSLGSDDPHAEAA